MGRIIFTAAFLIAAISLAAEAQITYLSQARSITVSAGIPTLQQTTSAMDFGVFDQTLDFLAPNPPDPLPTSPVLYSNGFAFQHSELDPDSIVMYGRVGGTDAYGSAGAGTGVGNSALNTSFLLAQPTWFTLATSQSTIGYYDSTFWHVRLTKGAQEIFNWQWTWSAGEELMLSKSASGILDAGTYTLDAAFHDGWWRLSEGTSFSDHSVLLSVPEPASVVALLLIMGGLRERPTKPKAKLSAANRTRCDRSDARLFAHASIHP